MFYATEALGQNRHKHRSKSFYGVKLGLERSTQPTIENERKAMARKLECWKEPVNEMMREFEDQFVPVVSLAKSGDRFTGTTCTRRIRIDRAYSIGFVPGVGKVRPKN